MSDSVKILVGDKYYEFPVVKGSKNERAININSLRAETGLITIDPGYKNSGSCLSEITYLNGEKGDAGRSSFAGQWVENITSSFLPLTLL